MKITITKDFYDKARALRLTGRLVLLPPEKQVATEHDRQHAKELAIKYQGKYGYPKLKD